MACAVADRATQFSDEELDKIRGSLSGRMNAVCTGCGYCAGCPNHVPVAGYMQFYNLKQLFGTSDEEMTSKVKEQHDWQLLVGSEATASECTECGLCEEKCTQHLDIIERLKQIAEWEEQAL
jgi:predicted aldo/keto reductase-like oxidoreductase